MFKKQHITKGEYDALSDEARARYKQFYLEVIGTTAGSEMVDGFPLMTIGECMTYLYRHTNSRWLIDFYGIRDKEKDPNEGQFIDPFWHAVRQHLEKNKNL